MITSCPKCGGILVPNFNTEGKLISKCNKCGYSTDDVMNGKIIGTTNGWIEKSFNKTRDGLLINGDKIIVISYLKAIREERGISQKQMADLFGFTEQRYGNVERNYNAPSVVLVSQFAYILGMPSGDIYKSVKISKNIYEEIKGLKIDRYNIVSSDELKTIITEMESISDKREQRYKELKKMYDKHITSAFLKGDLVESSYWEMYLEKKTDEEIKENIKEIIIDDSIKENIL
jgi:transcriptional regulator with XRE-family HTH domain